MIVQLLSMDKGLGSIFIALGRIKKERVFVFVMEIIVYIGNPGKP